VWIDARTTYVSFGGGLTRVSVALRNVGRGLAVIHPPGVHLEGDGVGPIEWRSVPRERVPVGESPRISLIFRCPPGIDIPSLAPQSEAEPWSLYIPYTDFVGRQPAYVHLRLSRETAGSPDEGWIIVSVEQILLDEFFHGETEGGRVLRLYSKNTGHESLVDTEGNPFEVVGQQFFIVTVDGQLVETESASIMDRPRRVGRDPAGRLRRVLTDLPLTAAAPPRDGNKVRMRAPCHPHQLLPNNRKHTVRTAVLTPKTSQNVPEI
jgi:hypothetical protein